MKPSHWLFLGGCAVLGLLIGYFLGMREVSPELRRLRQRADSLNAQVRRADTVYTRDTVTLTRTRTRVDSLLTVDTLLHTDTVRVLVAEERKACDAVIRSCEARVAVRDPLLAVKDSIIDAMQPPRFSFDLSGSSDLDGGLYIGADAAVRVLGAEVFGWVETRVDAPATEARVGVRLPL
jgi:hypothetical protein